ncbi:protein disulfide-isomerase tmx3 [Anaeramoeba flamelloides]|uniref:Protein disulfide-isomerase tmx3 n=1 Tax=Anaeramoeba flamelloides TaxID=1746091 RepID=A0AAV7Z967_9EUKA|nr:protein disulfide-isomerase tmx3 [Anaeramoeba flamelloides]
MQNSQAILLILLTIFVVNKCTVIELRTDNYEPEVILNKKSDWLIKYYASWCPHCIRMKKAFESASNSQEGLVRYGGVNCPSEDSICKDEGVGGYPKIRFRSQKGFWVQYRGNRSESSFVEFTNQFRHRSYNKITETKLMSLYSHYWISFIIYVPSKTSNSKNKKIEGHLQKLSDKGPDQYTFIHLDSALLNPASNPFDKKIELLLQDESNNDLPMLVSFQLGSLELYSGPFDDLTILDDWIKRKSVQKIQNFNYLDPLKLKQQKKFAVVSVINLKDDSTISLRSDMMKVEAKNKEKFKNFVFSWVDISRKNNKRDFENKYRIMKANIPALVVIDFEKDIFWNLNEIINGKNSNNTDIETFLSKIDTNKMEEPKINQTIQKVHFLSDTWFWFLILVVVIGYLYLKFVRPIVKKQRRRNEIHFL